jgi:hypothetical protein
MGKIYRTAQGRQLDIEKLRLQNESVPAIGNMRVNARGDQLGPGGKVVKSREQMLDDHYKTNVSKRANNPATDEIPTKGGKAQKIDAFAPGKIEPDPVVTAPTVMDDDFEDPPMPANEQALKGGLARAMAKSRELDTKSKPKRL